MNDKVMKDYQCLMIQTNDRKFFTHEKNYGQLIEFSKVFQAEISVVKVRAAAVLDLADLAPAICTTTPQPAVDYQIIEVKVPRGQKKRSDILLQAQTIKGFIRQQFAAGKVVSLKELARAFPKVTVACLCNHLTGVRTALRGQGQRVVKVGGGKYKVDSCRECS